MSWFRTSQKYLGELHRPTQKQSQFSVPYGEYWIGSDGDVMWADGDIGDKNHSSYVIDEILNSRNLTYDIFEQLQHCEYPLPNGSKDIYQELQKKGLKPIEISVLLDDNKAVDYGLQYLGWKRVHGNNIQTWKLSQNDLDIISKGLDYIAEEDEQGTSLWNIESNYPQKFLMGIPLAIIGMGLKAVQQYSAHGAIAPSLPNTASTKSWYKKSQQVTQAPTSLPYVSIGHSPKKVHCNWLFAIDNGKFVAKKQESPSHLHEDDKDWRYIEIDTYGRVDTCSKRASISQNPLWREKNILRARQEINMATQGIKKQFGNDISIFLFD